MMVTEDYRCRVNEVDFRLGTTPEGQKKGIGQVINLSEVYT